MVEVTEEDAEDRKEMENNNNNKLYLDEWMDRLRSDLRQHQLDPKLAQNREAWRKAINSRQG